ncbi:hypothetical protein WHR41_07555 [Cladosporium halotolerans]|uniref:Amino acid transporter n=1 Tax=Cladosporium halotolerans TaxID=1052096 RepID=A0AB34KHM0_9PEZI
MVSWQSMIVIDCYMVADIIQAVVQIARPDYVATRWRGTLLTMATGLVVSSFHILLASHLSWCEGVFATIHFFAFVPVLVGLFVLAPKQRAADVFLNFTDVHGNWPDRSIAVLVGQVSNFFVMLGSDGVAHLAEEIEDAGIILPRSMLYSYFVNAPLTVLMAAVFCFSVTSLPKALASPMPFVTVFHDVFQERDAAIAFSAVVLALVTMVAVSALAATSRQIFAFARDKGLPYSDWLATIDGRFDVPVNTIIITFLFTCCMSLINLGSKVAFEAMLSLATVALMATYLISIGCVLLKRVRGEPLPPARWSLGRYGTAVNAIAVVHTAWSFFWAFWPSTSDVHSGTFNWSCVLFLIFLACALLTYHLHAKHTYEGPASYITAREEE